MRNAKTLAMRIAEAARSKKAEDVRILDLRRIADFCDYFVIASASSLRQTNAIAEAVALELAKIHLKPLSRVAAEDQSGWIVLDFSSVIAHIFYKPQREHYALERLWQDALRVPVTKYERFPANNPKRTNL